QENGSDARHKVIKQEKRPMFNRGARSGGTGILACAKLAQARMPVPPESKVGRRRTAIHAPNMAFQMMSIRPCEGGLAGSTFPSPRQVKHFSRSKPGSVRKPEPPQVGHLNGSQPRGPASYSYDLLPWHSRQLGRPPQ